MANVPQRRLEKDGSVPKGLLKNDEPKGKVSDFNRQELSGQ
jgi:hypothetical protein